MKQWAENEVKLACKREAHDRKEGEWDYGCACYESALKAYNSLLDDGHSGLSWSFTRAILDRLMHGKPLTPIEEGDIWNEIGGSDDPIIYQCRRMSSLFKRVYADGRVEYSDNDLYICKNIDTGITFQGGPASRIISSMFPITFPYFPPTKPMVVYVEEFLFDKKTGISIQSAFCMRLKLMARKLKSIVIWQRHPQVSGTLTAMTTTCEKTCVLRSLRGRRNKCCSLYLWRSSLLGSLLWSMTIESTATVLRDGAISVRLVSCLGVLPFFSRS